MVDFVTLAVFGEAVFTGFTALIAYFALKRTPVLPTETQQAISKLEQTLSQHIKDDDKRFADLWAIANETKNAIGIQSSDIKVQIAEAKLANANVLTDIKVQLGKLVTSIAYIEGKLGKPAPTEENLD